MRSISSMPEPSLLKLIILIGILLKTCGRSTLIMADYMASCVNAGFTGVDSATVGALWRSNPTESSLDRCSSEYGEVPEIRLRPFLVFHHPLSRMIGKPRAFGVS